MKVRVLTVVDLPVGTRLVLNADQVRRRRGALMPIGKDLHQATAPVQFKAGERFGIEGDLDKAAAARVEILDGAAPASAQRPAKRKAALLSPALPAESGTGAHE